MKTEMSKSGFKARALEVFRHIERTGEPVIITGHGEPALIVRRYSPAAGTARQHRSTGAGWPVADQNSTGGPGHESSRG